jgi:predicted SAM-dependent methyltransferase
VDVGFGGDPIKRDSITVDLERPYTQVGLKPRHLSVAIGGMPWLTKWFAPRALDYVFSSHLIEDFTYAHQRQIIEDWETVVRPGGHIVLYQPDQRMFVAHCRRTGQPGNDAHKEPDYCLGHFADRVLEGLNLRVIHSSPLVEDYSWEIVLEKL